MVPVMINVINKKGEYQNARDKIIGRGTKACSQGTPLIEDESKGEEVTE